MKSPITFPRGISSARYSTRSFILIIPSLLLCIFLASYLMTTAYSQLRISEFGAANGSVIADEDNSFEDWIEIHNAGSAPVNLLNWSLTDSASDLLKWRFPETNINPGTFMVVFASGKDRQTPGKPLHTSFKLTSDGEYLALVDASGTNIVSQYAPTYPAQFEDVSFGYGLDRTDFILVSTNAAARVLVPTSNAIESQWAQKDFSDSNWRSAVNGIGFDTEVTDPVEDSFSATVLSAGPLGYWRFSETSGTIAANQGSLGATANASYLGNVGLNAVGPRPPRIGGFEAGNAAGQFNGSTTRVQVPDVPSFDFGAGPYTIAMWFNASNAATRSDLFTYKVSGNDYGIHLSSQTANTISVYHNSFIGTGGSVVSGQWNYLVVMRDGGGRTTAWINGVQVLTGTDSASMNIASDLLIGCNYGASLTAPSYVLNGAIDEVAIYNRALSETEIQQQYRIATGGGSSYKSNLLTDIQSDMHGINSSAYIRIPFVVPSLEAVSQLNLRMRYDDGFVAYLNGFEVTGANAPETNLWNSAATERHSDKQAMEFQDFNITDGRAYLVPGTNILAIQGLNIEASNPDFFIQAELVGTTFGSYGTAPRYFMQPTPGKPNGAGTADLGPIITHMGFSPAPPIKPLPTDSITVTARVTQAFSAVTNISLRYRVNYLAPTNAPMFDDGNHGDGLPGDGIFGVVFPPSAFAAGQMVRFSVTAQDAAGRSSRWPLFEDPNSSPEYLGTVIATPTLSSVLPIWEWFTADVANSKTRTGTRGALWFNGEFYDNIFIRLRGGFTTTGSQKFDFNPGNHCRINDELGRVEECNLNGNGSDTSYIRQPMAFETIRQGGNAASISFHVLMRMNGAADRVGIFIEQVDERFLERNGLDREGSLYKFVQRGTSPPVFSDATDGVEKKTRLNEDNSDLQAFVNGLNQSNAVARRAWFFDNINIPNFLNYCALRSIILDADDVRKNFYWYRDTRGNKEWSTFPWDKDWTFGVVGDGGSGLTHPFFGDFAHRKSNGDQWNRLYEFVFNDPVTRPLMLRRLRTVMDEMLQPPGTTAANGMFEQKTLSWMKVLAAALPSVSNQISSVLNYFPQRRTELYTSFSVLNTGAGTNNALVPQPTPANAVPQFGMLEANPSSRNQAEEFIELTNNTPFALDVSGWKLDGAVQMTFKPGTVIPAYGSMYLSPDVNAFRARSMAPRGGMGLFVQGNYQGKLSSRGETVDLKDNKGRIVRTITYPDSSSPAQKHLRITEIMYNPSPIPGNPTEAQEFEYIKLKNISSNVVLNLDGVYFDAGIVFSFTNAAITNLEPGQTVLIVKNIAAFRVRYGTSIPIAGQYTGNLNNGGEQIRLMDSNGEEILDFTYQNGWYPLTDGLGFSLVTVNDQAEPDLWDNKANWHTSGQLNGVPDQTSPTFPTFAPIVVNEILSSSETIRTLDAVELWNPSSQDVNIGGWFLSDDFNTPKKFRIPTGVTIKSNGFIVFSELDFNPGGTGFAFGSDGDEVWLFAADATGALTGYHHGFSFGSAQGDVTWGRHMLSTGNEILAPQSRSTLGTTNSGPLVGPLVITEIMYHPPDIGTTDNAADEFVEISNISSSNVWLSTSLMGARIPWQVKGGIGWIFETNSFLTAGESLLLVNFNPTNLAALDAFRAKYGVSTNVQIAGPYSGRLNNDQDEIELKKPILLQGTNLTHAIADQVDYTDSAPWPKPADGYDFSLQRKVPSEFGNDPANWIASVPSASSAQQLTASAPRIVTHPQGQSLVAGQSVILSVTAESDEPLSYQWMFNGVKLAAATNSLLPIIGISLEQAGDYEVLVYGSAGIAMSEKAVLSVQIPAIILQQPQTVSVRIKPDPAALPTTNASFSVSAYSPDTMTYQWLVNNMPIPDQTNTVLNITNVQSEDWGQYSVAISDSVGTVVSTPAWLYPCIRPGFLVNPVPQSVPVGNPVSVSVIATGWPPPFTFEWRRITPPATLASNVQNERISFATLMTTNVPATTQYRAIVKNPANTTGFAVQFAITTLADADKDGLPDAWESLHGFSSSNSEDRNADADGDGMSNAEEYVAGTNPTNALSKLSILSFSSDTSGVGLEFQRTSNRTYSVQYSDALGAGNWQTLTNLVAYPSNKVEGVIHTNQFNTNRFYRVATPARP